MLSLLFSFCLGCLLCSCASFTQESTMYLPLTRFNSGLVYSCVFSLGLSFPNISKSFDPSVLEVPGFGHFLLTQLELEESRNVEISWFGADEYIFGHFLARIFHWSVYMLFSTQYWIRSSQTITSKQDRFPGVIFCHLADMIFATWRLFTHDECIEGKKKKKGLS